MIDWTTNVNTILIFNTVLNFQFNDEIRRVPICIVLVYVGK